MYLKLAPEIHPDRQNNVSDGRFSLMKKAYDKLMEYLTNSEEEFYLSGPLLIQNPAPAIVAPIDTAASVPPEPTANIDEWDADIQALSLVS